MHKFDYSSEEIYSGWEKSNHYYNFLINFYRDFEKCSCFPPGHYYSPLIDIKEVKALEKLIFQYDKKEVKGINLNESEQLVLIKQFASFYKEIPFPNTKQDNYRYYFDNDVFSYTDAIMLYSFIRFFKPKRIIEVGSGFSSAVMLDTSSYFFENSMDLTFIEPFPERLYMLISKKDKSRSRILETKVQYTNLDLFKTLGKNDILFIDGSHVSKTGSDFNFLLFEVLPLLNKGVIIHFHDIFYPFEYPKAWVYEGRNWNEAYSLRAFLSYNTDFEILMFNDFMHKFHRESFSTMSDCYKNTGGSIWIVKK